MMASLLELGLEKVGQIVEIGIRKLCYILCSFIYQAIIFVYNIFQKLCNGRFLDNELLQAFSERIGLILGLVMLFIVIFSLIKMVLDPDKVTDKEMGATALIKKIVLVIVMLGTSSFVFDSLYMVQRLVVENNVISNLLLPVQLDEDTSTNFGSILAEELLFAFYHIDNFEGNSSSAVTKCEKTLKDLKTEIITYQDFTLGHTCLDTTVDVDVNGEKTSMFVVYYNWLLSVIVGVVVLYLIFMYCIGVGTRMIQLMFLEIVAPMAIVSYVSPKKDTMFSKWTKMYIATYIDVFIRIAVINFVVFIIATIFSSSNDSFIFWGSIGGEPTDFREKSFIIVIIIIALLTFAKKAPDLLKDLLPAGASKLGFGMHSPKQLFSNMLGGNYVQGGLKRGYGAVNVAGRTVVGNARNAFGKFLDEKSNLEKANNALAEAKRNGDQNEIEQAQKKLAEVRATRRNWIARGTFGALASVVGGAVAGAKTKDAAGRKSAVASGVKRTKNTYKTRDAGYGSSLAGLFTEKGREGAANYLKDVPYKVFNRDTNLADMIDAKELEVQSKQQEIMNIQKTYSGPTVSKAKRGGYIVEGYNNGNPMTETELNTLIESQPILDTGRRIADLSAEAGKAKAQADALRNAKDEQKK